MRNGTSRGEANQTRIVMNLFGHPELEVILTFPKTDTQSVTRNTGLGVRSMELQVRKAVYVWSVKKKMIVEAKRVNALYKKVSM